jgi:hypothetical protein
MPSWIACPRTASLRQDSQDNQLRLPDDGLDAELFESRNFELWFRFISKPYTNLELSASRAFDRLGNQ